MGARYHWLGLKDSGPPLSAQIRLQEYGFTNTFAQWWRKYLSKFATQSTVGRAAYTKGQLLPPAQEWGAAPEHCFCFENFVPPQFVSHSRITGHLPNKTNPKLIAFCYSNFKVRKKQFKIALTKQNIYFFPQIGQWDDRGVQANYRQCDPGSVSCHVLPCLVPDPLAAGGFFLLFASDPVSMSCPADAAVVIQTLVIVPECSSLFLIWVVQNVSWPGWCYQLWWWCYRLEL